uniref:Uncharacterized protein n=1 Tax=Rhizophora mucronata TaxID=61149 RepID=A0A2P2Q0N9_RHIMU
MLYWDTFYDLAYHVYCFFSFQFSHFV